MTSNYTTTAMVKRQLSLQVIGTNNTVDDDLIDLYVSQASQMISTECLRQFSETVGTLFYDATYPVVQNNILYFDQDWIGVDAISNGANGTINSSDYRLLPISYTPKYALQLLSKSSLNWQVGNDGYSQSAICVIGTQGYCLSSDRPADITLAATRLAAWLYQTRDNDGSSVQMADGSINIPANAPPMVFKTLSKYIRRVAYSEPNHS